MNNLRKFRILLAVVFMAAAIAYILTPLPTKGALRMVAGSQIVPSMIASSMGAILFWIIVTLLLGRVYCASFCPVGIVQDAVIRLRRHSPWRRRFRYHPARPVRYHIAAIYGVCLVIGFLVVPYLIEPWNMFCDLAATTDHTPVHDAWIRLGVGALVGMVGGIVSLVLIMVWAWLQGREYCNVVCPIGTLLSLMEPRAIMHIEINPDACMGCLKCEEVCRASCISVKDRHVDNKRCIRCFDCLDACKHDAIRYQIDRNRAATPMLHSTK